MLYQSGSRSLTGTKTSIRRPRIDSKIAKSEKYYQFRPGSEIEMNISGFEIDSKFSKSLKYYHFQDVCHFKMNTKRKKTHFCGFPSRTTCCRQANVRQKCVLLALPICGMPEGGRTSAKMSFLAFISLTPFTFQYIIPL